MVCKIYFNLKRFRFIVIAEYQNIVYNEYFRALINPEDFRTYELDIEPSIYDPNLDPTITSEMSTAALRYVFHMH